ncbi:MAG: hypothetical protein ACI86M_001027 [Saprospiraceae bacterium]|jgi:hypothetical protein
MEAHYRRSHKDQLELCLFMLQSGFLIGLSELFIFRLTVNAEVIISGRSLFYTDYYWKYCKLEMAYGR